jgi:menaquinone reductase, multiheme cytochrome c subunit
VTFGFSPQATDVGFMPSQPVPYSHTLHAGKLGIDCRYCHTSVETGANANVPPSQTCMGCHTNLGLPDEAAKRFELVKNRHAEGKSVDWVKIHDLPDYAYFNHSAHVRRGVGCVTCHGRIDQMDVVYQSKPLSMSWCLDCHRNPEQYLRPVSEVTNMTWMPPDGKDNATWVREEWSKPDSRVPKVRPSQDCSTCHR